jgi:hypothetical protein
MRVTPFGLLGVITMAAAAALPCVAVILLTLPAKQILNALAAMAF